MILALVTVFSFGVLKASAEDSEPEYVLATESDFGGAKGSGFRYIGTDEYVEVPHVIKGVNMTSYKGLFEGTSVKGVKSTNTNVTNMYGMFKDSQASTLDLSRLDTSNVTNMVYMFADSLATELDLRNFDTSNVTAMNHMFNGSQALQIDLSSFDTSNVTNMQAMFFNSVATEIYLSSFNTSNVTRMDYMFNNSQVMELDLSSFNTSKVSFSADMFTKSPATVGFARTQADADRLNKTTGKPSTLIFKEGKPPKPEPTEPTDPENPEDVDGDGSNSEGSTTGSNDVFFELGTGGLFLETSPINGFGVIPLTGAIEYYTTSFQNPFKVTDLRGTLEGWKINVSATQFKVVEPEAGFAEGSEANVLPTGTLLLSDGVEVGSIDPQATELPTGSLTGNTIIDSGSVQVVEALQGEGAGEYTLTFSENALTLVIDPATAKVDTVNYLGENTPYESTLTWDLVSAP